MLVGGVEFGGGALRALDCVAEAVGQGVDGVGGVGQWREVVDAEPAVVVLALKPAGELAEELGEHAGHGGEGGDDLGGVGGFSQAVGGGAGAVVELANGVRGLVGDLAGGEVLVVCAGHQNGDPSSGLCSSPVWRSRAMRRPVRL